MRFTLGFWVYALNRLNRFGHQLRFQLECFGRGNGWLVAGVFLGQGNSGQALAN